jgi:hypothetical protein
MYDSSKALKTLNAVTACVTTNFVDKLELCKVEVWMTVITL